MPTPGPLELVLILVIVTMLFGVGKLPEVFGSVGKGIREFRKNSQTDDEIEAADNVTVVSTPVATPPVTTTPVTTTPVNTSTVNGTVESSEATKA